jgi:hypothetical protein
MDLPLARISSAFAMIFAPTRGLIPEDARWIGVRTRRMVGEMPRRER